MTKKQFSRPKGTEDYFPEDQKLRNWIFDKWREVAKTFNFKEVSTPAFESIELLTEKEGEEIKEQIFVLEKRSKEYFGLRFDLTVPMTRMFMNKQKELQKPVKWVAFDRMWRYERPQAGRLREFFQGSFELFGSQSPAADAEVISVAIKLLLNLGAKEKDFIVLINNRKLIQGLLLEIIPEEKMEDALRIIDKRAKIDEEVFNKELADIGVKDPKALGEILDITNIKDVEKLEKNGLAQEGFLELKEVLSLLKDKSCVKLNLGSVRGLSYYTGTVFEVYDKDMEFRSLAGGGRYDELVGLFGGQSTPATGFAMGTATLKLFLEKNKLIPETKEGPEYFVAPMFKELVPKAQEITNKLRQKTSVELDLMGRKLTKQLQYADSINAKKVIILGEDELKEKKVTIKNLEDGKEEKVSISDL